jgi:hypothetical protein
LFREIALRIFPVQEPDLVFLFRDEFLQVRRTNSGPPFARAKRMSMAIPLALEGDHHGLILK